MFKKVSNFVISLIRILFCFGVISAQQTPSQFPTQCPEISPTTTNTINLITKQPQLNTWIEGGFIFADESQWVHVSTTLTSFHDVVVFVSVPEIIGELQDDGTRVGYPAIARVRNVVSTGQVSFETKLYLANDSYCVKTWYTPKPISPAVKLAWMVVELGAFNVSGKELFIGKGPITRQNSETTNQNNFVRFDYPSGCTSATAACSFGENVEVGIITQLQTVVYDRLLIPRGVSIQRRFSRIVLQPHDSVDPNYYVMLSPETLAFVAFATDIKISCVERLTFETHKFYPVTHVAVNVAYRYNYTNPPGVFGMVGSSVSLADSTGLRTFDSTSTGTSIVTQEDQCYDEEMVHTTQEVVFAFVVGEQIQQSTCTVCRAFFTLEKTKAPTFAPTMLPTSKPTTVPTAFPTSVPSSFPSCDPTSSPTTIPSTQPSATPTSAPTSIPSPLPSRIPTGFPTSTPTVQPTGYPSSSPSSYPTALPTAHPTGKPSCIPSSVPTAMPSFSPTGIPSGQPSCTPTTSPSSEPTTLPTTSPSSIPSAVPSNKPSAVPSVIPSTIPSSLPTTTPSSLPSGIPSEVPTAQPTSAPSAVPTCAPTSPPSTIPTVNPSSIPTSFPSGLPTSSPTSVPSTRPTALPSGSPSSTPSFSPSALPSFMPSASPTLIPTGLPSSVPSSCPSSMPSKMPSIRPTSLPTSQPTAMPSTVPTSLPSAAPTSLPSPSPSSVPTVCPSSMPSAMPSSGPTSYPTPLPTALPTSVPSSQPSAPPSSLPSFSPFANPTSLPTSNPTEIRVFVDYDALDSRDLKNYFPPLGNLYFDFYINEPNDYGVVAAAWKSFVAKKLSSPFSIDYYNITVFLVGVEHGGEILFDHSYGCNNATLTNAVVRSSITDRGETIYSSCKNAQWKRYPGGFCIGCTPLHSSCSDPLHGIISLPNPVGCVDEHMSKFAGVVIFRYENTVAESVPTMQHLSLVASSNSSVITAVISSTSTGGMLYCVADLASLASPDRYKVKTKGVVSVIPTSQTKSNVTVIVRLANLIPSTEYTAYCFIEDSMGNSDSMSNMLRFKRPFTSLCCRVITFTNAPKLVLPDLATNTMKGYIFRYQLPLSPKAYPLHVTPRFRNIATGHFTPNVIATPTSATFSQDNSHHGLGREFVVSVPDSFVGNTYTVTLDIVGIEAEKYAAYHPSYPSFLVVDESYEFPPPVVDTIEIASNGRDITVCFDLDTVSRPQIVSIAPASTSWQCSVLFVFQGNDYSSCKWKNSKCVLITPCGGDMCDGIDRHSLELLEPGDNIEVQPSVFVAHNRLLSTTTTTVLSPPSNAVSPRAFVKSNQPGGVCKSDLIIDGSASFGSGGRNWKVVEWSISCRNPGVNVTEIQLMLKNINRISPPIVVPYNMLIPNETYTLSLRLRNYLQQESVGSLEVKVFPDYVNTVNITIDGLPFRIIKTFDEFTASSSIQLPQCRSYGNISYVWKVYSNSIFTDVVSESADPRMLKVPPYTFQPNQLYQVLVDVVVDGVHRDTASLLVFVEGGSVYVSISGENSVLLPLSAPLILDTSRSVFEDIIPSTSVLDLRWNCKVTAVFSNHSLSGNMTYGSSCDHLLQYTAYKSTEPVSVNTISMSNSFEYTFSVAASMPSSETIVSSTVAVRIGEWKLSPRVHITSSFRKFNPSKILRLRGTIFADDAALGIVNATWTLFGPGGEISLSQKVNTPISREIKYLNATASYVSLSSFPLTYEPGVSYTFRLTAVPVNNPGAESWAQISIVANTPPSSGTLLLSPSKGIELSTEFVLSAQDWSDDIADYPLSYTFWYSKSPFVSEDAVSAMIGMKGHTSVIASKLPAGLSSWTHIIFCKVAVSDFYDSAAHEEALATVSPGNVTLTSDALNLALLNAYSSSDANAIMRIVNNAAEVLNVVNCSASPNCSSLHRHDCSGAHHTCGLCLEGYTGIAAHSNFPCFLDDIRNGIGSACSKSVDCFYGQCFNGVCIEPNKPCPSQYYGTICSGHGVCSFATTSGDTLPSCGALRDDCYSFCSCHDGYYGAACGYSHDVYIERSVSRKLMCDALFNLDDIQDDTQTLLSAIASSLLHVFVPGEIYSADALHSCADVLVKLISLTEAGLLRNDNLYAFQSPQQHISALVSAFSINTQYMLLRNDTTDMWKSQLLSLGDVLENMVSLIATSIHNDMVVGEADHIIESKGVKLRVVYAQVDSLSSATLASSDTGHYLVLPPSGLSVCGWEPELNSTDAYARLAIAEWIINPHLASLSDFAGNLSGNILRFSTAGLSNIDKSMKANLSEPYYVVLRYEHPKNLTSIKPECVSYDEELNLYGDCPCNVTSFTPLNMTLECYNLIELCPLLSSRRKLNIKDVYDDTYHPYHSQHRRLDFDYAGDNDDDEDSSKPNVHQYGTLVRSIKRDIINTLTNNPVETIDSITQALPVLTMLIFFVAMLLMGWQYFATWDENDYNAIRYSREIFDEKKKKIAGVQRTKSLQLLQAFMGAGYAADKGSMPHLRPLPTLKSQKSLTLLHPAESVRIIDVDLVPSSRKSWYEWMTGSSSFSMQPKQLKSQLRLDECASYGVNGSLFTRTSLKTHPRKYVTKGSFSERIQIGEVERDDSVDMASLDKFFCSVDEDEDMWGAIKFENDENLESSDGENVHSWNHALTVTGPSCYEEDTTKSIDTFSADSSGQQAKFDNVTIYPTLEPNSTRKLNVLEGATDPPNTSSNADTQKQVLETVFPASSLLESKSAWKRFIQAVFREHDWVRMFSYPSIRLPRKLRFLVVCSNILIIMFVDSLFYGILFADEDSCKRLSETTLEECESKPSTMRDDTSKCMWDETDESCVLRPPPSSIQFYLFVTLFVAIFTVAPTLMCQVLIEEVCSKRPKFSNELTLTTWGSSAHSSLGKAVKARNVGEDMKLARLLDLYTYLEFSSVKEEANILLSSVEASLQNALMESRLPWHVVSDENAENMKALMDFISVYPDGSPMPLTLFQQCIFGNPRKKIEWKIKRVRQKVENILDELNLFVPGEDDYKDTLLIQHFVLEQLSPFKRYALRKEFFQFDNALPGYVDGWKWVIAWSIVVATWLFYMLWIFQWAALHSEVTMVSWFIQLILAILQDVFIVEVVQIYVVHVLAIEALRPQLKRIYHILNGIVVDKLRKGMISMRHVNVVQHLSAACRAARTRAAQNLPAAQLLMRIDDADVARCRNRQNDQLGWIIIAVIAIPTALALAPDSIQQGVLELVIPTVWCCFLLCNYYLYDISPYLLAAPYVTLFLYLVYYYAILKPRRHAKTSRFTGHVRMRSAGESSVLRSAWKGHFDVFGASMSKSSQTEKYNLQWRNMNLPLSLVFHAEPSDKSSAVYQLSRSDQSYELARRDSLAKRNSVSRRHTWLFADDLSDDAHSSLQQSSRQSLPCRPSMNTWLCNHVNDTSSTVPLVTADDSSKLGDAVGDIPEEIVSMKVNASVENFVHRNLQSRRNSARLMNKYVWNADMT